MNIFKKAFQNAKRNQEHIQQLKGFSLGWFVYVILGSVFVAIRISAMIEDEVHLDVVFLGSFFAIFGILVLLKYLTNQAKK